MDRKEELELMCAKVKKPDAEAMEASRQHWDRIAKPIDGLGLLEKMIIKIAGIQGKEEVSLDKKAIVVMCSDNGVVEEGVTQTDSSVTAIVAENFARGTASVNRMALVAGADIIPVDIGINQDLTEAGIQNLKIGYGTKNLAKEPAMELKEALDGIHAGIRLVGELKDGGYDILGTGEMGIGNTTTSSAIASVLLDLPVEAVTGKGAGLSDEGIRHKIEVIKKALRLHCLDGSNPLEVLACLGGYDIAGLTGVFLGGAVYQIPIVIDGLISSIAALLAARICPVSAEYMIPSHLSKEPCAKAVMDELGLCPVILGQLALGEGTGAVLLFPMLDMALSVYREFNTFESNHIPAYEKF